MGKFDFRETKEKITVLEQAKNKKRTEMNELYRSLTENTEFLDMLMLQIGKDIEENFPGVRFRLISRIKTEKSFSDKLENDLIGLVDKSKVEEVKIYDIVALSIIIEHVSHNIKSSDESFNTHILELIDMRQTTKASLKMHYDQVEDYKKRIEELVKIKQEKIELKKKNELKIKELSAIIKEHPELKNVLKGQQEHLYDVRQVIGKSIESIEAEVKALKQDINNMESIIERTKERYDKEDNECNHAMADFIIKNLPKFENVKALNLIEIPKRLKQKENYDGYRAIHDCYEARVKCKNDNGENEDFYFVCEIQGKSIDAFYVADRGKAATYHTDPKQIPGKIVKSKKLPDILSIRTPEEIEAFREKVRITVPRFRIYRHVVPKDKQKKSVADIYQLSMKENFLCYYYNQLFGNEELGLLPQEAKTRDLVEGTKLSDEAKIYKDYEYEEL